MGEEPDNLPFNTSRVLIHMNMYAGVLGSGGMERG